MIDSVSFHYLYLKDLVAALDEAVLVLVYSLRGASRLLRFMSNAAPAAGASPEKCYLSGSVEPKKNILRPNLLLTSFIQSTAQTFDIVVSEPSYFAPLALSTLPFLLFAHPDYRPPCESDFCPSYLSRFCLRSLFIIHSWGLERGYCNPRHGAKALRNRWAALALQQPLIVSHKCTEG